MAKVVESIEISRRPEDVFAYVADASHHPEWIDSSVSARREDAGPHAVGSTVRATRRVGPWKVRITERMDELDPPTLGRTTGSAVSRSSPLPTARLSRSMRASDRV